MTRSVKRTRHRSRQRARPKTRRKTRQRVKRRTKNYSKKRKNTRKKNYSKKVVQEGGMFGCFGKDNLVEEGEDAKDVFRRLIDAEDELPQDTTLEVFGGPDEGLTRRLFRLSYTSHNSWRNVYHFQQNYEGNEVVFEFPGPLLIELLDETSVETQYPVTGIYKARNILSKFYNYEFGGATPGHRHLNVLQSDKINKGVDKNRKRGTKKAAKGSKKIGISQEDYQRGTERFTGTPHDLRKTGFTVGAAGRMRGSSLSSGVTSQSSMGPDESVEVQATEPELQPAPDESIEALSVSTTGTPRKPTIMMKGSDGSGFIPHQVPAENSQRTAAQESQRVSLKRVSDAQKNLQNAVQNHPDTETMKKQHQDLISQSQREHKARKDVVEARKNRRVTQEGARRASARVTQSLYHPEANTFIPI